MIIWAMALKDLRLLFRDRTGAFFTFAFPMVFSVFFGMVFSGGSADDRRIPVAIVDLDQSAGSRAFVSDLLAAEEFSATDVNAALTTKRAADAAATGTTAAPITTDDLVKAGDQRVLAKQAAAVVVIPKDFGERQKALFSGKSPEIDVGVDPSRTAETGMLLGVLQKYAFMGMARSFQDPALGRTLLRNSRTAATLSGTKIPPKVEKLFTDLEGVLADAEKNGLGNAPAAAAAETKPGDKPTDDPAKPAAKASPMAGFSPMTITSRQVKSKRAGPSNPFAISFPQGIVWGVMGAALGFGSSLVGERQNGTLARLRCAPLSITQVLLGKALGCGITTLIVIGLLLGLARFGFGVEFAEPVSLVMAIISVIVCFVGIMMLVAAISPSERASGGLAWGIMMIFSFIGGAAVPLFAMPGWLQRLSDFSPMKWTILAFEGGIWRGTAPAQMLLPCGILLAIGIAAFFGGAAGFTRKPAA